jgi:hypothetical protein
MRVNAGKVSRSFWPGCRPAQSTFGCLTPSRTAYHLLEALEPACNAFMARQELRNASRHTQGRRGVATVDTVLQLARSGRLRMYVFLSHQLASEDCTSSCQAWPSMSDSHLSTGLAIAIAALTSTTLVYQYLRQHDALKVLQVGRHVLAACLGPALTMLCTSSRCPVCCRQRCFARRSCASQSVKGAYELSALSAKL